MVSPPPSTKPDQTYKWQAKLNGTKETIKLEYKKPNIYDNTAPEYYVQTVMEFYATFEENKNLSKDKYIKKATVILFRKV